MKERRRPHSLFFPLLLIVVGIAMLLNTLHLIQGSTLDTLLRLWPLLFIAGGLDSLYRREGAVGAVLAIGVGTIFLLGNFGYLPASGWMLLLRYWPVLLIAAGLDILISRRSLGAQIIAIVLGMALVGGLFWLVQAPAGTLVEGQELTQALDGAQSASISLDMPAGNAVIQAGAKAGSLVDATLRLTGSERADKSYSVSGGRGIFRLQNQGLTVYYPQVSNAPKWDLRLTGAIPLDVTSNLAVGEQKLNLNEIQLANVAMETAVGRSVVTLPPRGSFNAKIDVAVGEIILNIPRGTAVRIRASTGLGTLSMPPDYVRRDGWIYSPGADSATERIELNVNVALGLLQIIQN